MLLGLLLLFSNGVKEIFLKKSLKWVDPSLLVWLLSLSTALIVLPFVVAEGMPTISWKFMLTFLAGGICYFTWKYCYYKALQLGELSYISPLKWLVSISAVFTGWLLLDDIPSVLWFIGIMFTIIWVYILSIKKWSKGFFAPIKHLFVDKGSRIYMIAVVAYGFTISIDKMGVTQTSPLFWVLCMNLFLFCTVLPNIIKDYSKIWKLLKEYKMILLGAIMLHAFVYILHMNAVEYILPSYLSAFKNSCSIVAIIAWWVFFKEKDIMQKLFATVIIILWVVCMIFA